MRRSPSIVPSGGAASSDSDSKQTIPGPVGHSAELGEAVALAASLFSAASFLQPTRSWSPLFAIASVLEEPRLSIGSASVENITNPMNAYHTDFVWDAEGVGFEPTVGFPTLDFESSALNRTQPPFRQAKKTPNVER